MEKIDGGRWVFSTKAQKAERGQARVDNYCWGEMNFPAISDGENHGFSNQSAG